MRMTGGHPVRRIDALNPGPRFRDAEGPFLGSAVMQVREADLVVPSARVIGGIATDRAGGADLRPGDAVHRAGAPAGKAAPVVRDRRG